MDLNFSLTEEGDGLFKISESVMYHRLSDLHSHREIELICIIEGRGTLLIGDEATQVEDGNLILIGGGTPHLFEFDKFYYYFPLQKQGQVPVNLKLLTLHFNAGALGESFRKLPENKILNRLFSNSEKGFFIQNDCKKPVVEMMYQLTKAPAHQHIILLLQLFTHIATSDGLVFITNKPDRDNFNITDEKRLTKVYLYTLQNFTRNIKLKEVADIVYMVPNAFCRFFKTRTNKSYFEFLMDVRIKHACKLLKEKDYSVVVVCDESGFSNLSNFNRYFKLMTGKTPLEYRKGFKG